MRRLGAILPIRGGRGGAGAKIAPTLGDPPMGRYYHVVIIAELNSALPPWAAALVEYLIRTL